MGEADNRIILERHNTCLCIFNLVLFSILAIKDSHLTRFDCPFHMQDDFIQHLFSLRILKMKILQVFPDLASCVNTIPNVVLRIHDIHYIQIGIKNGRHVRHPTQELHHFGVCRLIGVFLTFPVIQDTDKDDHHQDNQTDKENHFYRMFLP